MNKIIGIAIIMAAICIAAPLGYFSDRLSIQPKPSEYKQNNAAINQMLAINSAWGLAALRTMAIAESDFDAVADFLDQFRILRDQLRNSELTANDAPSTLKNTLFQFVSLMQGKELAIEQFKSKHAVMRNSIKYFPIASRAMIGRATKAEDNELADSIQILRNQIEDYLKVPEEGARSRILIELSKLQDTLLERPPQLSNLLGNFLSHADVLVKGKMPMNEVVTRVTDNQANHAGAELLSQYRQYENERQATFIQNKQQNLLYIQILTGLLALLAFLSGIAYFMGARKIPDQVNQLVEERTKELNLKMKTANNQVAGTAHCNNMEALNKVVASVAHEINTPLAYLGSNLEVAQIGMKKIAVFNEELKSFTDSCRDAPTDYPESVLSFINTSSNIMENAMVDEFPEIVQDMRDGIEQINHVVKELKEFSRKDQQEQDWFNANHCVESALKMSHHELGDSVQIQTNLSDLPDTYGSAAEINQVLINLIGNATYAVKNMPDTHHQGIIKIRTAIDNQWIIIDVLDNGIGMTDETSQKVFDPFFTTKDVGKGTGLGLSIAQRIIKQHHGRLLVKSTLGKGTLLRVILPIVKKTTSL